jgi:hypothetical protein
LGTGPLVLLESDVAPPSLTFGRLSSSLSSKMDDAEEGLWLWLWLLSPDFFLKKIHH